jgi:hypothetical protein
VIRSYNRDYVTLDYQLLNGHTRIVRYHRHEWQTAQYVPLHDHRVGLTDKQTCCSVMSAIVDVAFRPFQPRPRRTYLEAATALVMACLGVKDEDCGEGEVK